MIVRELPVSIKTQRLFMINLNVLYPVVYGLTDLAVQDRINNAILGLVYKLIKDQAYYENPLTTQVTGTYEIKTNERGILSLSVINYAFAGGAHGMTIIKSLTFDVQTGKMYELKDLFKPGSDYVKRLSDIVQRQIIERNIPLLVEFKGIQPNQDYYIADKCLVIYFQLYELAAYVFGFLYFPISVYQIQDIIDEDGPLGRMLY